VRTRSESSYSKRVEQPWQRRAFDYYHRIGEFRYAAQTYAKMMSRVRYYPAFQRPDGTIEEITGGPPVERLNRIQDPGGGRSRLQYDYGRLMWITGEGYLFGYRLDTDEERWKFLWKDELKFGEAGQAVRIDLNGRETSDVGIAYRFWTSDPEQSDEADSPMRGIGDIAEELLVLTASVMGTAVSRMTNGIIVMAREGIPEDPEAHDGGEEDPENNVFLSDYIEHTQSQIENPGSAAAKVPFLYTPPSDYAGQEFFRWVQTHDPQNDYLERELRKECITRASIAFDIPPESLTGMAAVNHWGTKQLIHDLWRSHGYLKAEQFADDLAEGYLRPGLQEDGYADWNKVVIGMDDSQVVISPDRTEIANNALDRIAISFAAYRELIGVGEDKAPSEEEKEFLASLKMRQPVEIEGQSLMVGQRGPEPSTNGNAPAEDGPPAPTGGRDVSRQEATASAEILGAARLSLLRCRELAGSRLRRHQQKCEECKELTDGAPNALVAALLGPEQVKALSDPMSLVSGGAEGFRVILADYGFDSTQASSLSQMLEVHAARTLCYEHLPELPPGFVAQVRKAREVSQELAA
jgi:hypothetical protein